MIPIGDDRADGLLPIPPNMALSYTPAFLKSLSTPLGVKVPYSVVPDPPGRGMPDQAEAEGGGAGGARDLWKGEYDVAAFSLRRGCA